MKEEEYWKKFESSGQIDDYMQFKQSPMPAVSQATPKECVDANHYPGAGAPSHQNG